MKMSPFESLYGKKCNTLVSWDNIVDIMVIGLEMLKDIEEKIVDQSKFEDSESQIEKLCI